MHLFCHAGAIVDVMLPIGHNLRLHDGHKALALADGGIASRCVHGVPDCQIAWNSFCRVELEHISPLGKTSSLSICLGTPLLQVIQSDSCDLWVLQWTDFCTPNALLIVAFVDLDARDHAVRHDVLYHIRAISIFLEERFPMQDYAADVLAEAGCREAQRPVGSTILNRVWDLCGIRMASTKPRACGLISCQKSLAWRTQLRSRLFQLCQNVSWRIDARCAEGTAKRLLHKPDHVQLPVALTIICPVRVIAHSFDTTRISEISDDVHWSHPLEVLCACGVQGVRREQGLTIRLKETFISFQHAIQPREHLFGTHISVDDNRDTISRRQISHIMHANNSTKDGSLPLSVWQAFSNKRRRPFHRELNDHWAAHGTSSFKARVHSA